MPGNAPRTEIHAASTPDERQGSRFDHLDPLSQLAIVHGTDKYGDHFYTPHYHRLLAPLRGRKVTVLEAGVGGYDDPEAGGEGLAMWRDYFAFGKIVGIDLSAKRLDLGPRVEVRRASMADQTLMRELGEEFGPFDLVVDDGSHVSADTIRFVEAIFPYVADGGFLAIEDTQTSYWPEFQGSLSPVANTTMNFVKSLLDEVDHAERSLAPAGPRPHPFAAEIRAIHRFHNLVVIEKGDNAGSSNFARDRGADPARREALAVYRELIESEAATEATALSAVRLAHVCYGAEAALSEAEHALASFPDSWRLNLCAAQMALKLSRVDLAAAHAERAKREERLDAELLIAQAPKLRARFPDLAAGTETTALMRPDAINCLRAARIYELLKERQDMLRWLHEGTRLSGLQASDCAEFASAFRRAGDLTSALALSERAVRGSPTPSNLVRHGTLLRALGRLEEAVETLTAATALDWSRARAHLERSHALAALGRHAEASEASRSFMELSRQAQQTSAR